MARTVQIPVVKFAATPAAPSVTNIGIAGASSRSWVVVATDSSGAKSAASPVGSTSTGNASPNGSNFDRLNWTAIPGAVTYDVYRTAGGGSQGKIASGLVANTFDDTGVAGDGTTAPSTNVTGIGAPVDISELKDLLFQVDGTFVGSVTLEFQLTGATGWLPPASGLPVTAPALLSFQGGVPIPPGANLVRARMPAFTSGTPAVWCRGNGRV